MYFTGAIPPLPLALKEAGIYHGISRVGVEYRLLTEPAAWYEAYLPYKTVFHGTEGESAYLYTAVFAPAGLSTIIFHEWQHYDQGMHSWITEQTIPFPIVGGRDEGYRGYTIKEEPALGDWRVNVMTEFGHIIGRVSFRVVTASESVPLEVVIR